MCLLEKVNLNIRIFGFDDLSPMEIGRKWAITIVLLYLLLARTGRR